MINYDEILLNRKKSAEEMQAAFKENDAAKFSKAYESMITSIKDEIMMDYTKYQITQDKQILINRGIRQLTNEETEYYNKLRDAMKSPDPKMALSNMTITLPETTIDDIFKDLVEEHPLLNRINFQNTSYLTRWLLNDHTAQAAKWGTITEEITKEITSGFKKVELTGNKMTAFMIIDAAMLDLGNQWIDSYVREVLKESAALGLEQAIVSGTGKDCPIGLDRDIHEGVSVTAGVYPRKNKTAVKSFTPKEYGSIVAKLSKTEKGKKRKFSSALLICNMTDYLTKIMPATTVQNTGGTYTNNIFPFPTNVEISNELADNEAILCLPEEYFMGVNMNTKIEFSDEFKFLEDQRAYKTKFYGNGRPYDNTVSLLLDITNLEEAYITVKTKSAAADEGAGA